MTRSSTTLGAAIFGALIAGLPVGLHQSAGRDDLVARVPSAHHLAASPGVRVDMQLTEGSTVEHLLPPGQPGLDLVTARKTYGNAYMREVTWPSLIGPFHPDSSYVCGYGLNFGAGLFDTQGAGAGLKRLIAKHVSEQFPAKFDLEGLDISLPEVATTDFNVALRDGYIWISLSLRLVDKTDLALGFWAQVEMVDHMPQLRRVADSTPEVYFEGPSKERIVEQGRAKGSQFFAALGGGAGCLVGPVGCFLGAILGGVVGDSVGEDKATTRIPENTQLIARQKIDDALAHFTLGMKAFGQPFPVPGRPGDTIRVRLEKNPSVTSSGLKLPLCVQITALVPSGDPSVPGAVAVGAPGIADRRIGSGAPVITATLSANAINHVVHYLWQSGLLREAGQSQMVLDGLADRVRMAALDFTGFDPMLPPTLMTGANGRSGIPFVVANVRLGTMGKRDVLAHGQTILNLIQEGDSIRLEGQVANAHVNCAQKDRSGIMLTPCLSDLLPVAREMAASRPPASHRFAGADLLGKLPELGFRDARLRLSELQVTSDSNPVQVTISTRARLE